MKNIKSIFSKSAFVFAALLSISSVSAQNAFTVKGSLGKGKQGKIRMHYKDGDRYVTDSTQMNDGVFVLKRKMGEPAFATIVLNPTNPNAWRTSMGSVKDNQINFYLE